jgi:uncharacterized membrane protein
MKTEERPKLKIQLTPTDQIFELLGWGVLLALWVWIGTSYSSLPDTIPTHFNAAGEADGFGTKASIIGLPLIATLLYIGLTLLNRFPHIFNFPTPITPDNALSQYTNATRMIRYLKLILVLVFAGISFQTIQQAKGTGEGLGVWFLPLTLVLVFLPLVYFVVNSLKKSQ